MLADAREPLGKVISRKLRSKQYRSGLPGAPCFDCFKDNKYVVIQYDTVFENKMSATETITSMMEDDGKWRIFDYYISKCRVGEAKRNPPFSNSK